MELREKVRSSEKREYTGKNATRVGGKERGREADKARMNTSFCEVNAVKKVKNMLVQAVLLAVSKRQCGHYYVR